MFGWRITLMEASPECYLYNVEQFSRIQQGGLRWASQILGQDQDQVQAERNSILVLVWQAWSVQFPSRLLIASSRRSGCTGAGQCRRRRPNIVPTLQ